MKYTGKITDSHLHMHGGYTDTDGLYRGMERLGAEAGYTAKNVVMVPQWDAEFIGQNILGILYKALYPGRLFCYAGFDYYKPSGVDGTDLERQAREYAAMGFDGIKMVELKPTVYRNLGGVRLGGPRYDGMFSFLEESGMPVLLHMGDPETFWHRDRAPAFAVENGWLYGEGGYPELEALYADVENMLRRHPGLKVSLAHFFFLSDDIERAERVMAEYPGACLDITPGTEMYGSFSQIPEKWRDFFIAHSGRILFGTDNGWGSMTPMEEKIAFARENVGVMRRFLETGDSFEGYGMALRGLDLPVTALENIYWKNFERIAGKTPKPVAMDRAAAYASRMAELYRGTGVPFYARVFPQIEAMSERLEALAAI